MTYLPPLPPLWAELLSCGEEQRSAIDAELALRAHAGESIYPPKELIFRALALTPPQAVKVVILGQDPYHGAGEAEGLAFSVPSGVATPPSLRNIFKEYASDLSLPFPSTTSLTPWAEQGVLLINSSLTVQAHTPLSHSKLGWQEWTTTLLSTLAQKRHQLSFLLWGKEAQKHAPLLEGKGHQILHAPHPSPLSAHRGFWGSRPFSTINNWRISQGLTPMDWELP